MRRMPVLGAVGMLLAGTLAFTPKASADHDPTAAGAVAGGVNAAGTAEAAGVRVAAARAARAGVHWARCPANWGLGPSIRCGFVQVPSNYARPGGDTIRLALSRTTSTGSAAEHQGALVYNPGGPGGSGLTFPRRVVTRNPLWRQASRAYDFVGFDPRGVGRSAPISCQDPQEFIRAPKPDPVPDGAADRLRGRRTAHRYAHGCAARGGPLLPLMTTPNMARDLDVIRAALGERGLNYLGVSYGTYLGAIYATLFPTHLRRMVLDSVVNPAPDKIWYQDNLDQDVAFQGRWRDWERWVARHEGTYHLGSTAEQVEQQWLKLRAAAGSKPLGGVVGPAELVSFFQSAPYFDSTWPIVADQLSKYRAGDAQPLIDSAAPDPSDTAANAARENSNAVYTAVECNDAAWPTRWPVWDRDNTRLHRRYPFLTWANAWQNLPCATWPVPSQRPLDVRTGRGLPRVLIVQSARDAATPYPGAVEVHRRLNGSRLITERDAGSHGVTSLSNRCVNDRVTGYLVHGRLDGHDVVCGPHAEPQPVATVGDRTVRRAAAPTTDLPATPLW